MTDLNIIPTIRDGVQVLVVEGEIDASCANILEAALTDQQPGVPIVADLSLLTFIDSSGLHVLAQAAEAGRLAAIVQAPNSNISRVLNIIQANNIVPLFDDPPAAIRHVKERAAW